MEITIDRPKANAIDMATSRALGDAFIGYRDDPGLRVAIVTGAGERIFSAGWPSLTSIRSWCCRADAAWWSPTS